MIAEWDNLLQLTYPIDFLVVGNELVEAEARVSALETSEGLSLAFDSLELLLFDLGN